MRLVGQNVTIFPVNTSHYSITFSQLMIFSIYKDSTFNLKCLQIRRKCSKSSSTDAIASEVKQF